MHYSPQIAMMQAVITSLVFVFCLAHSWRYDQFKTFAFWRIKTRGQALQCLVVWCFVCGLPLFATQGIVYSVIKYKYGFLPMDFTGNPIPYTFWSKSDQALIEPLSYVIAMSWVFNVTIHLQELSYWIHLTGISSTSPSYFASWHFYLFVIGSLLSLAITFAITGTFAGSNPLRLEAALYLYGALSTLAVNCGFFYVNRVFPQFLAKWKAQGAAPDLIARLYTFHVFNTSRLACVMLFCIPLCILSLDGLTEAHPINYHMWAVDFLLIIGLIGFACQAVLTYMIFQPRNLGKEFGYRSAFAANTTSSPGQSFAANVTFQREALVRSNKGSDFDIIRPEKLAHESDAELAFSGLAVSAIDHPYSANNRGLGHARVESGLSSLESGEGNCRGLPMQLVTHVSPICPR